MNVYERGGESLCVKHCQQSLAHEEQAGSSISVDDKDGGDDNLNSFTLPHNVDSHYYLPRVGGRRSRVGSGELSFRSAGEAI